MMANNDEAKSRGALVAATLAGTWRQSPPALKISQRELDEVAPLLVGSGAGALGWWRVNHSDLRHSPAALQLKQAYLINVLYTAIHAQEIKHTFTLLRAAGVEPILIKGWAVARLYPEPSLRPSGDIDLCVRPEQYARAEAVLKKAEARKCVVDLHGGLDKLGGRGVDELYAHSRLEKLDDLDIRVLGPEDHFRVLCVHLLIHDAWRPLWLCDVAAAVEFRTADFDWDRCLGHNRRRADWVIHTIGLAQELLGAQVKDDFIERKIQQMPGWLIPNVLKLWGEPPTRHRQGMATYLRRPSGMLTDIRNRWPNPIGATVRAKGPFNELPRLPFQLGECFSRTAKFLLQLPKLLREQE